MIDPASLTEDELETIQSRRDRDYAMHECKMMAALLSELSRVDRDLGEVGAVNWLANRLCDRLDQLEDNLP